MIEAKPGYSWSNRMDFIEGAEGTLGHDADAIARLCLSDDKFSKRVLTGMVHVR